VENVKHFESVAPVGHRWDNIRRVVVIML